MKGFVINLEAATIKGRYFRQVLYTAKHSQLVIMSLRPGEEIGEEVHSLDQFIRIESGKGNAVLNGIEQPVEDGYAVVIPAGVKHNVINLSSTDDLKLYTIYSPPDHKDRLVNETKEDVISGDRPFDGQTTE